MIHNPIHKVLSTFCTMNVNALLIGGQACVLYGGVEFSVDSDFIIQSDDDNLSKIANVLEVLAAKNIAVPPFKPEFLEKGHAIHFRCQAEEVENLRIDIMSKMRNVDSFDNLWRRRTSLTIKDDLRLEMIGLPDLVASKKTQRDKDWLMIRNVVESDFRNNRVSPNSTMVSFWLLESRTPETLITLALGHKSLAESLSDERPLLKAALASDTSMILKGMNEEKETERVKDIEYWRPLKKELEFLRKQKLAGQL